MPALFHRFAMLNSSLVLLSCAFRVFLALMKHLLVKKIILHRILSIKHDTDFLQRDLRCLWVRKVDHDNLQGDDDVKDDVIFPADVGQSDRVEIVEARDCRLHQQVLRTDELWANVVTHALHCITSQDPIPSRCIEGVEDEDEGDDRRTGPPDPIYNVHGVTY